ncbi:MAG: hypothetical protein H7245_15105, partial [Candidatus Saccharibacteria bacterium]|nr:hypothetical protein [Pseudorhodobacter sp.]
MKCSLADRVETRRGKGLAMQVMGWGKADLLRKAGYVTKAGPGLLAVLLLSACSGGDVDWDMRNNDSATSAAVGNATRDRPTPDDNGVISYPGYQVIVARRGDRVADLAARVGLSGTQLAS